MASAKASAEILAVLARDDAGGLDLMIDEGLDPRSELDAAEEITLLEVAIREGAFRCVRRILGRRGDWTLAGTPFHEDLESPLAFAIEKGSDETLLAFAEEGIVGEYSNDWLRDALIGLPLRPPSPATLAILEAADARPGGLPPLLSDVELARSLLSKAEQARAHADRGTRGRWENVEESLRKATKRRGSLLREVQYLATGCHHTREKTLIESLPEEWRSEAAGRALACAIRSGNWSFAEDLLSMKPDLEARIPGGTTPLMAAAEAGELSWFRRLLDLGANPDVREAGMNARSLLELTSHPGIRRLLEKLSREEA